MRKGILIGCGYFGNVQLEGWRRVGDGRIVAVVDPDATRAGQTAGRFGVTPYTDLRRALAETDPDFVDVAAPPSVHLPIVEVAAAKGCHVLCQKPVATTWDDAVRVVETCREHGVRLMINENWRWQPWYREIKALLEAGSIGRVTTVTIIRHEADALETPPFANQPYFVAMEPFLLMESAIHPIDVVRFLGGDIRAIFCDTRRVSGVTRGEDTVCVQLVLENDARGLIYSTRCSEPDVPHPICDYARVEGSDGFIRLDRDGQITVKPLFRPAFVHAYEIPEAGYRGDSARRALQHFVECLSSGQPFETEGEDYLQQVMRAVFAGYESAQTRREIRL